MKFIIIIPVLVLVSCLSRNAETIYEIKNNNTKGIDSKQKAVLALSPGAWNVGDEYLVYIISDNDEIRNNDYGIVFAANNRDSVLPRDSSKIKLKWISSSTLKIIFDKRLRILKQVIRTRDNVIVYEEIDSLKQSEFWTPSNEPIPRRRLK